MSMPRAFIPSMNKVTDFTRNRIQMNPIGLTTFGPYSTLVLQLQDGIADLSTLAFTGYATAYETNTALTVGSTDKLPLLPSIERFIDQLSISIGGQDVCTLNYYNQLWTCLSPYKNNDRFNLRSIMNLQPGSKESTTAGDANAASTTYVQPNPQKGIGFVLNTFLGFLGTQKILYTNRLPPVRITIRFSSANVVCAGTTAGSAPSFLLSNVNGYCDYLTVSPEFNQLISDRLAQGPLPLVFSNYQSQLCGPTTSLSTSNRISTNAACVESIMYTWLKTTYNSAGIPDPDTYHSPYFNHGVDELKALCKTIGGYTANFSINGQLIPQYNSDMSQMQILHDTLVMLQEDQDCTSEVHANLNSLAKYAQKFFLHGRSLTYYDSDGSNRLMGVDSRGNSSEMYVNTNSNNASTNSAYNMLIILCLKSTLMMGPNRTTQLIH